MGTDSILIVDDEPGVLSALRRSLAEEPYEVVAASGGEPALGELGLRPFKVVISDERMPGMDGAAFLAIVRERYPETVRILLTGHASVEATMRAVNCGEIYRFFTKPWDDVELRLAIRGAIEKHDLESENRRLLKTVRRQSREIRRMEARYPGISAVERDAQGAVILPEVTDEEIAAIVAACNGEENGR